MSLQSSSGIGAEEKRFWRCHFLGWSCIVVNVGAKFWFGLEEGTFSCLSLVGPCEILNLNYPTPLLWLLTLVSQLRNKERHSAGHGQCSHATVFTLITQGTILSFPLHAQSPAICLFWARVSQVDITSFTPPFDISPALWQKSSQMGDLVSITVLSAQSTALDI